MKKTILLLSILSSIGTVQASIQYKCSSPESFTQVITFNRNEITISIFDEESDELFVDEALCEQLPSGNLKNSLICTDEDGLSMNFVLDKVHKVLEFSGLFGDKETSNCTKL